MGFFFAVDALPPARRDVRLSKLACSDLPKTHATRARRSFETTNLGAALVRACLGRRLIQRQ